MNTDIYQQNILEHAKHPHNKAEMYEPTVSAPAKNASCGDSQILYLRIEEEVIVEATFSGIGCAISQAAASMLTDKLAGMSMRDAKKISEEDIRTMLGVPLSVSREKCAFLALHALEENLRNYV